MVACSIHASLEIVELVTAVPALLTWLVCSIHATLEIVELVAAVPVEVACSIHASARGGRAPLMACSLVVACSIFRDC